MAIRRAGEVAESAASAGAAASRGASGAVSSSRLRQLVGEVQRRLKHRVTPQEFRTLQNAIARNENLTQEEVLRLLNTPASAVQKADDAPAAASIIQPVEGMQARPFMDKGKGVLVGEDGRPVQKLIGPNGKWDGESFVYDDGVVVDVSGDVKGRVASGELTDAGGGEQADNLAASAIDLGDDGEVALKSPSRSGGTQNLSPNKKKIDKREELARTIFSATKDTDTESHDRSSLARLLKQAQAYRSTDGSYDPDFLAAISPDAEYAAEKMATLERMASRDNAGRAAETIDKAAQARAAAGKPTPPSSASANAALRSIDKKIGVTDGSPAPVMSTPADLAAARSLAGESLPAGDWDALTKAFNELDETSKASVLAALPAGTRKFLSGMMDPNQQGPSFLPNMVAAKTRPINDVDELFAQREVAKQAGDQSTVDAINELLSSSGGTQSDEVTDAVRALNERESAASLLRNAIIDRSDLVAPEKLRAQLAASPQPQPTTVAPGARTPEFRADDLPAGEMPNAFDEALSTATDARLANEARAPGGGLTEEQRLEIAKQRLRDAGVSEDKVQQLTNADLPFFLRGRDRSDPFERRSRGERANQLGTGDTEAIADAEKLQAEVDAAHKAWDEAWAASKSATGAADLAKATQAVDAADARLTAAYDALDKRFPKGARRAMPDSVLNKGGQQETYDDLVTAIVGYRPVPQRSLNRASAGLDADDAASMQSGAKRVFGDDVDELLDGAFDDDWSVSPVDIEANGPQKKGRLGGQPQNSRIAGAMQRMFGEYNPLTLSGESGRAFESPAAVATEILSRGTLFKPGTANYDLAHERLTQAIDRAYSAYPAPPVRPQPPPTPPASAADTLAPVAGGDVSGGALDPVGGTPARGLAEAILAEETASAAKETLAPVVGGRIKSVDEIQSEADEVWKAARAQAREEGLSGKKADAFANKARKNFVESELKARPSQPAGTAAPTVTDQNLDASATNLDPVGTAPATPAAQATTAPEVTGGDLPRVGDDAAAASPDEPASAQTVRSKQYDTASSSPQPEEPTSTTVRTSQIEPGGGSKPATPEAAPSKWTTRGKVLLGGGILGGLVGLGNYVYRLGGGAGSPPGGVGGEGGSGGGSTGGDFYPIPVSTGSSVVDESAAAAEEEDRIASTLDRIRGKPTVNRVPTFQTVQNYNGWR